MCFLSPSFSFLGLASLSSHSLVILSIMFVLGWCQIHGYQRGYPEQLQPQQAPLPHYFAPQSAGSHSLTLPVFSSQRAPYANNNLNRSSQYVLRPNPVATRPVAKSYTLSLLPAPIACSQPKAAFLQVCLCLPLKLNLEKNPFSVIPDKMLSNFCCTWSPNRSHRRGAPSQFLFTLIFEL